MTTDKFINISINGNHYSIAEGASIAQAITLLESTYSEQQDESDSEQKCFVIALNQNFVPRSQYQKTQLQDSDAIELLSPMAGG